MKKTFYTPVQKILIGILVICGVALVISDSIFKWEETGNPCMFTYISQGEYMLNITCMPADRNNQITVFSKEAINTDGKAGMILAQADMEPGEQYISIPLSMENGIYSVSVVTDLDTEEMTMVQSACLESRGIIYRDGTVLGIICFLSALFLAVMWVWLLLGLGSV